MPMNYTEVSSANPHIKTVKGIDEVILRASIILHYTFS